MGLTSCWFVYILECTNGAYYVGISKDVVGRFEAHKRAQGAEFTKRYLPVKVLWTESHATSSSARQREHQIKGWSRHKKQKLISGII